MRRPVSRLRWNSSCSPCSFPRGSTIKVPVVHVGSTTPERAHDAESIVCFRIERDRAGSKLPSLALQKYLFLNQLQGSQISRESAPFFRPFQIGFWNGWGGVFF